MSALPLTTIDHAGALPRDEVMVAQPGSMLRPLIDGQGRTIDHLRLSVTSVCNLRCAYCRPGNDAPLSAHALTDSQRIDLIRFLHRSCGLRQVRFTGGEPLLHPSLIELIDRTRSIAPDLMLAMTTNGCRLSTQAADLRAAGLERLNISLDTLDPERYRELTGGRLDDVLAGIDAAQAAGFEHIKLNVVVLRCINETELPALVRWAFARGIEIRFLEAMPIGPAAVFNREHFVDAAEIRRILEQSFRLRPLPRNPGETARRYQADTGDGLGTVGLIAPLSESFCGQCRRIRVTAEGRLFPCLLDDRNTDLRTTWVEDVFQPEAAGALITRAIRGKPTRGQALQQTAMVQLGG